MKWIVFLVVVLLSSLLFIGSPNNHDSRILEQIWQSGHFALFAGFIYLILQSKFLVEKKFSVLFIIVTVLTASFGLLTEFLQSLVGRQFELIDLINDMLGGYAGLLMTQLCKKNNPLKYSHIFISLIIVTGLGLHQLVFISIDEWFSKRQFPVLADFDTPFELSRWDKNHSEISISDEQKITGKHSLKIEIQPGMYSGVSLRHFNRDWRKFDKISFSLYNSSKQSQNIILKIFDVVHPQSGYNYSDRFNLALEMKPGWNNYSYPLKMIKNSPKLRSMEMHSILNFSLFIINSETRTTLYLDNLKLI